MTISPLHYTDAQGDLEVTGETLLNHENLPYKIWIPQKKVIVLGNSQVAETEINVEACLSDNIPIYKRHGGGGAVLLSPACICVALRFKKDKAWHIPDYFKTGSGIIREALQKNLKIEAEASGISDLSFRGKKILGCSLYMPKGFALYLASVLVRDNISEIEKYLGHPSREPEYRGQRGHREFLTCVDALSGSTVDTAALEDWIKAEIKLQEECLDF